MDTGRNIGTCTAFLGERCVATGGLAEVALKTKALADAAPEAPVIFFADRTGEVVDINLHGTPSTVRQRLADQFQADESLGEVPDESSTEALPSDASSVRGRGRPRLGVVAREVTLLPRHWDWLATQPGSASVTLRRLIDEARRTHAVRDRRRQGQKAAYLFMSAMAGNRVNFEEATRSLFAADQRRFTELIDAWPPDVRRYATRLAADAFVGDSTASTAPVA